MNKIAVCLMSISIFLVSGSARVVNSEETKIENKEDGFHLKELKVKTKNSPEALRRKCERLDNKIQEAELAISKRREEAMSRVDSVVVDTLKTTPKKRGFVKRVISNIR